MCVAGAGAAPLFAAETTQPTVAEPAVIFKPLQPVVQNVPEAGEVPVPEPEAIETAEKFESLAAMVAAADTAAPLTAEEECLAIATYFESKSESLEGQHAVAHVVINRAASGRYRPTMCGVVKQPGQFSFVRGGRLPAVNKASRDWREAVAVSRIAMAGSWKSAAPGAMSFHARRVSPGWKLKRVGTVGNHVFYR